MNRNTKFIFSFTLVLCFLQVSLLLVAQEYVPRTDMGKKLLPLVEKINNDIEKTICTGVRLVEIDYQVRNQKQYIFLAEVNLDFVTVAVSTPDNRNVLPTGATSLDMTHHAANAQKSGETVWLGVNGDFFDINGTYAPSGIFYKAGVALHQTTAQHNEALYVSRQGEVKIGTVTQALALGDNLYYALGGYYFLVRDGVVNALLSAQLGAMATDTHPRTVVGIDKDNRRLYLLLAEGRRAGYAVGETLPALAGMLKAFGAHNAMHIDGGGSSTLVGRREVSGVITFPCLNKPSDNVLRKVPNGLLVVAKKYCGCK